MDMIRRYSLLVVLTLVLSVHLLANDSVRLGTSVFKPPYNLAQSTRTPSDAMMGPAVGGQRNALVQFGALPNANTIANLRNAGVHLISYVGGNAYWALVSTTRSAVNLRTALRESGAVSIVAPQKEWKLTHGVALGRAPQHARVDSQQARYTVRYAVNASREVIMHDFKRAGANEIRLNEALLEVTCVLPTRAVMRLAELPYVLYVSFIPSPLEAFNTQAAVQARARILAASSTHLGGRSLQGEGVRVGVWDENVTHHPDFGNRLHTEEYEMSGDHGTHVAGTLAGSGFIDPSAKGIAPRAEIWAYNFGLQSNGKMPAEEMRDAYNAHHLHLTSNSYGVSLRGRCEDYLSFGYGPREEQIDQLALDLPELTHIYAAGNDQTQCQEESERHYGITGYNTGTNRAKNIIQVGSVAPDGFISPFSSQGPQDDGRWMPIVCAEGNSVYSTLPGNAYGSMGGTSMACPVVSGVVALLQERYAQLHPNKRLLNSAVKALLANTANDAGRPHPDFQYGFGIVNAECAVKAMEAQQLLHASLRNGQTFKRKISIPKGSREVRVMVVWNDPVAIKAHAYGEPVLVNDLDLNVEAAGKRYAPWVCSAKKGEVDAPAVRVKDTLNNIEQVTLSAEELEGIQEIEITVAGSRIATGEQSFALTWVFIADSPRIVTPSDGQIVEPGAQVLLQLENPPMHYTLELSLDGGKNYITLGEATGDMLEFPIPVDAPLTTEATVRLRGDRQEVVTMEGFFSVVPRVENVKVDFTPCARASWRVSWDKIPGAKYGYEVFLGSPDIEPRSIGGTDNADLTQLEVDYSKLEGITPPYFSVAVRLDSKGTAYGLRSFAASPNASMPLTLGSNDFPFEESFIRYPSPFFTIEDQGKNIKYAMVYRSADHVPNGSNALTFYADNRAASFNEHDYFDISRNADNRVAYSLCQLDLTGLPSAETVYIHIHGILLSRNEERPETARLRVVIDGHVAQDVGGISEQRASRHDQQWSYAIAGGQTHSISIEFVGAGTASAIAEGGRDMLALSAISFERAKPDPRVALSVLRVPFDGPNLTRGTFTLRLQNLGGTELLNLPVKAFRQGKWVGGAQVERLMPYESKEVDVQLDLATNNPLGEHLHFNFACELDTLRRVLNGYAEYIINSMGSVVPMPTSYSFERPEGYDPFQFDPKQTIEVAERIVFTDNGGAQADYSVGQLASVRFKPADTTQRLRIRFKKVDLEDEKAYLLVFTTTPNSRLELERMRTRAQLTGQHDAPITFISESRNGSLCFQFGSPVASRGEGWIAEIEPVPSRNPLALLEANALLVGEEPEGKIPVQLKVLNRWQSEQRNARASLCIGHNEIFAETLPPLQPGLNSITLEQRFTLGPAQPMPIALTIAGNDGDETDNVVTTTAIYDFYCIPQLALAGENFHIAAIRARGKEYKLAAAATHIRYTLDSPIPLYTQEGAVAITAQLSESAPERGLLALWVDWNGNGEFEDSELQAQRYNAGATEVVFSLQPASHEPGVKRMRFLLAEQGVVLSPCAPSEKKIYDIQDALLSIEAGDYPSKGDLRLVSIDAGESGVNLSAKQPIKLIVANLSNTTFEGTFAATLNLDGIETREVLSCANQPLPPYGGTATFTLQEHANFASLGVHNLSVRIEEQPSPVNEKNNSISTQVVCVKPEADGFYALHILREKDEWIDPGARGLLVVDAEGVERAARNATLEFCFRLQHAQFAKILHARGLSIYSTLNMQGGIPSNALAILVGQRKVAWTPESSLQPGSWHHVTVVLEDCESSVWMINGHSSLRVYIDGQEQTLHVEGEDGPDYKDLKLFSQYDGFVKLYRAWEKALTGSEVKALSFQYARGANGQLPDGCLAEFAFNEGPGNFLAISGTQYARIHAESSRISATDGIWSVPKGLLAGFLFEGQARIEKKGSDSYEVLFEKGTPRDAIPGRFFTVWPATTITTNPPVSADGKYNFTNPLVVTAEATPFGHPIKQTISLAYKEDASAACELLALTVAASANAGLATDVTAATPIGQRVALNIKSANGLIEHPEAVKISYEVSPGAMLIYNGKEFKSDTKIDLRTPALLAVRAANGRVKTYSVTLAYEQSITFVLATTTFTYGDSPVVLTGSSTSGLPIDYATDDPRVASVAAGILYINRPGKTTVSALQRGNHLYGTALPVEINIEVKKAMARVQSATPSVLFGTPLSLHFDYIGLKNGDLTAALPSPLASGAYDMQDKMGQTYSAHEVLPVGDYTLKAKGPYSTDFYEIVPLDGSFRVEQGRLWPVRVYVKDEKTGEPLAEVEVVCNGEKHMTDLHGCATAILQEGKRYAFRLRKPGYADAAFEEDLTTGRPITREVRLSPERRELIYSAATGGEVIGALKQHIAVGGTGEKVLAVPTPPYRFSGWSDGVKDNPRRDAHVLTSKRVEALFSLPVYKLIYSATDGGYLDGSVEQRVEHGRSGAAVEAVPLGSNYFFAGWSDGFDQAERTDRSIEHSLAVEASFDTLRSLPACYGMESLGRELKTLRANLAEPLWSLCESVTHDGVNYKMTGTFAALRQEGRSAIYTPTYSLKNITSDIAITLQAMAIGAGSQLRLQYSLGGGAWHDLPLTPLPMPQAQTLKVEHTALKGAASIRFRWEATVGAKGFAALDNVCIYAESKRVITISYRADPNESATFWRGPSSIESQTVSLGAIAQPVEARPAHGFQFLRWSHGGQESMQPALLPIRDTLFVAHCVDAASEIVRYKADPVAAGVFTVAGERADCQVIPKGQRASRVVAHEKEGYWFTFWDDNGSCSHERLSERGESGRRTVRAVFEKTRYELCARVVGDSGPIKLAAISVEGRSLATDEKGECRIMVPEGHFKLQASAQGYSSIAKEIEVVENTTVELQLSLVEPQPSPKPPTPPVVAAEAKRGLTLRLWPNPVSDVLYVEVPSASFSDYEVRCATGACVMRGEVKKEGILAIPIGNLPAGVYLIVFYDDSGVVVSARFAIH